MSCFYNAFPPERVGKGRMKVFNYQVFGTIEMGLRQTAVIFVGYQNDYFADDGILRAVIEESSPIRQPIVILMSATRMRKISAKPSTFTSPITTPWIF